MKLHGPVLLLLIAAAALAATRHKPVIDPESQDGILLQRIQQEPLAPRKQALLERFVEQYPQATNIAWVYEQLLPIYNEAQQYDKELATAESLLAVDPSDLDAAHHALLASQAKNDLELAEKYARIAWDLASKAAQSPKPTDEDEITAWTKDISFARDVMDFSEYALYSQGRESADPQRKMDLIHIIEQRNPQSKYLDSARKDYFHAFEKTQGPEQTLAMAEKTLVEQPDNEEMLMIVAQYYFDREREPQKVLNYAQLVIEVLERKPQPDDLSAEAWATRKAQYAGLANWMIGTIHARDGRYALSDRYLRSAMPHIHDDKLLAAAYYYLGYDNYAIAIEQHDRGRAQDAMKYTKLCAEMSGPFQAAAQKNLLALKGEFNLQ